MGGENMDGPADLDMLWEVVREGDRASIEALLIGVRASHAKPTANDFRCEKRARKRQKDCTFLTRALCSLASIRTTTTRPSASPSTCATTRA